MSVFVMMNWPARRRTASGPFRAHTAPARAGPGPSAEFIRRRGRRRGRERPPGAAGPPRRRGYLGRICVSAISGTRPVRMRDKLRSPVSHRQAARVLDRQGQRRVMFTSLYNEPTRQREIRGGTGGRDLAASGRKSKQRRKGHAPVYRHGTCPVAHRTPEAAAKCRNR